MFFSEKKIKLDVEPRINVIIPSKNNLDYLLDCLDSFNDVVNYKNYKIIIADTGSEITILNEIDDYIDSDLKNLNIKLIKYNYYNFAKINNDIVKNHLDNDCELILFCNDDIYLLNDTVSRCVDVYNKNKENVGTIGIRLHYEDKTIQHAGLYIKRRNDILIITHNGLRTNNIYNGIDYNSMGNTGAFLMINRKLFNNIGGFNENYMECFEDVELNLEALLFNKINITNNDAVAYHFESVSRKKSNEKKERESDDFLNKLHKFYLENKKSLDLKIKEI